MTDPENVTCTFAEADADKFVYGRILMASEDVSEITLDLYHTLPSDGKIIHSRKRNTGYLSCTYRRV